MVIKVNVYWSSVILVVLFLKDHTDETLQVVPVAIMKEVAIVTDDVSSLHGFLYNPYFGSSLLIFLPFLFSS